MLEWLKIQSLERSEID